MTMKKIIEVLSLKRSIVSLLLMAIFVGFGERMAERFLPIYLLALGASTLIPGFLNGLDNLLSALYSIPGGFLSARLGYKRALLIFNLTAIVGYTIVILFSSWVAVVVGSLFFLSWTALSLPAVMDLVGSVLPKSKQVMGVSLHAFVRRIPMALGPIVGGILIDKLGIVAGIKVSFGVALVFALISLVVQQLFIEDRRSGEVPPISLRLLLSPQLNILLLSDILVRFCEQIPYAYIAIWAMQVGAHVSGFQFGILTAIEMIVALLVYIPVAYLADRGRKKPFVVITYMNFALFPLFLLFSKTFFLLVIAFIVRGLKEFGEPTRKALIMELAPCGVASFGTYYFIRDTVVAGSAILGAFLWQASPSTNFLTASLFGILGVLAFGLFGKDASQ
jgi:MFS family permease